MKAEKIQKEQMQRTIQPMRKGGGTAQFVDNRNAVQLTSSEDEEESLQLKKDSTLQRKSNNTGLPDNLKTGVENLSGLSMDDVRVHYNSPKPATVQALAYTQGADIHVAPGQEQYLPHETWHVVQQMQGRVQPTTEVGGMPVNNDVGLEREADVMGSQSYSLSEQKQTIQNKSIDRTVVQCFDTEPIYKDMKKRLDLRTDVPVFYIDFDDETISYDNESYKSLAEEIAGKLKGNDFRTQVENMGGGAFNPELGYILMTTNVREGFDRTLLHEMGHFKQLSELGDKYNQPSSLFIETHNIIVNENKNLSLSPPLSCLDDYAKIKDEGISEPKYRRIAYKDINAVTVSNKTRPRFNLLAEKIKSTEINTMYEKMKTEIEAIDKDEKGTVKIGKDEEKKEEEINTYNASIRFFNNAINNINKINKLS
ncbi:MAG: DUF4157 domain-containing protein [Dysgonomonas sp.]|nr:DUF4157 domain-containing protein [Dysgonomonas sp.]